MSPEKIIMSNPQGQINMSSSSTKEQLARALGFSYNIGGNWDVFNVSAGANYLHEAIDSLYTLNFSYLQTITGEATLSPGYGEHEVLS